MTTEMIERDVALRVAVGDPQPVSVEDAARLVAEIRRLRAAADRVRELLCADPDLLSSGGAGYVRTSRIERALDGEV